LLSSVVMSEVLFIALAILLLGTSERALEETATRPARDLWLGAATGALTLVRAQAIALPLAVIALFLLERQWRRAAWCAAAVMLVMLPWQLWVAVHDSLLAGPLRGSYGSYLRWYGRGLASGGVAFVWHTAATNIVEVTSLIADRVAPWPYGWMRLTALGGRHLRRGTTHRRARTRRRARNSSRGRGPWCRIATLHRRYAIERALRARLVCKIQIALERVVFRVVFVTSRCRRRERRKNDRELPFHGFSPSWDTQVSAGDVPFASFGRPLQKHFPTTRLAC